VEAVVLATTAGALSWQLLLMEIAEFSKLSIGSEEPGQSRRSVNMSERLDWFQQLGKPLMFVELPEQPEQLGQPARPVQLAQLVRLEQLEQQDRQELLALRQPFPSALSQQATLGQTRKSSILERLAQPFSTSRFQEETSDRPVQLDKPGQLARLEPRQR